MRSPQKRNKRRNFIDMNNLSERGIKILASLGLILTTMIWGFAFVVMKNSVDIIPPAYLLAVRFSMSALLLAVLFHKNLLRATISIFS